jgi:hypothetical protein
MSVDWGKKRVRRGFRRGRKKRKKGGLPRPGVLRRHWEIRQLTVDLLGDLVLGERWEEGESLKEPVKREKNEKLVK